MSVGQMPFDQNMLNQFISQGPKFFLSSDGKHNDKTWDNKLSYKVWAMLAGLGMLSISCWSVYAGKHVKQFILGYACWVIHTELCINRVLQAKKCMLICVCCHSMLASSCWDLHAGICMLGKACWFLYAEMCMLDRWYWAMEFWNKLAHSTRPSAMHRKVFTRLALVVNVTNLYIFVAEVRISKLECFSLLRLFSQV
jgi:hypothetical protein